MSGSIDAVSREIGQLAGTLNSVLREIQGMREDTRKDVDEIFAKMDKADEDRSALHENLVTLTHDLRGVEKVVGGVSERQEQIDKAIADKLDAQKKQNEITSQKLIQLERWQTRVAARIAAWVGVGTFLGWVLTQLVWPLLDKLVGWKR